MEIEIEMESKKDKKKKEYGKYEKYQVENWVNTLIEAEEIQNDPEKMKYVKMCAAKKKKAINSISDLKDRAKEVISEENSEY